MFYEIIVGTEELPQWRLQALYNLTQLVGHEDWKVLLGGPAGGGYWQLGCDPPVGVS